MRSSGHQTIRRPGVGARKNDRFKSQFTIKTMKHSPSVMVWGGFSMRGAGGLFFLPPKVTMNSERYCDVLRDHMLPFMETHNCEWFLQVCSFSLID